MQYPRIYEKDFEFTGQYTATSGKLVASIDLKNPTSSSGLSYFLVSGWAIVGTSRMDVASIPMERGTKVFDAVLIAHLMLTQLHLMVEQFHLRKELAALQSRHPY